MTTPEENWKDQGALQAYGYLAKRTAESGFLQSLDWTNLKITAWKYRWTPLYVLLVIWAIGIYNGGWIPWAYRLVFPW
jgi:hypothetical protein